MNCNVKYLVIMHIDTQLRCFRPIYRQVVRIVQQSLRLLTIWVAFSTYEAKQFGIHCAFRGPSYLYRLTLILAWMRNPSIMMFGMKLLGHYQTPTVQLMKFGYEWVNSPHILLGIWLLIHAGIKGNPCQGKGPKISQPLTAIVHI